MKLHFLVLCLLPSCYLFAQANPQHYPVDSASVTHAGVPKGELIHERFSASRIFPGTVRDCWVYVPAQYHGDKPACLYVNQDGIQWNAPVVFDNLIASGEMPVTIGVFVTPGKIPATDPATANDRYNRSFEYDGLGDNYVRFLQQELLPFVETLHTSDGRSVMLSHQAADRAIGGSSSGAICAFTAAWEHPVAFSRVFSAIGTYVGLRGGDRYPTLIRKTEPKPIRIYLQDGSNDLNIYAGDWWKANETMERALRFAGYSVMHDWGSDGHNGRHGSSVFPDAMRWLWKGWPAPVQKGFTQNQVLKEILDTASGWELVGQGYGFTEGVCSRSDGTVFFQDIPNSSLYRIDGSGKPVRVPGNTHQASGTCFDQAGNRYSVNKMQQLIRYSPEEKETTILTGINGNDLIVTAPGRIYLTAPEGAEKPGRIFLLNPDGSRQMVDSGIRYPNGLALSPDHQQLYVTESTSHWIWVFSVAADGTLHNKQRYGWLHVLDNDDNAWSDGIKCDTAGRVYAATRSGIQVLDQIGRVNAIIPVPGPAPSNLCFGGKDFDILYVTCRDKVYRRKLHTRGVLSFQPPQKLLPPKL